MRRLPVLHAVVFFLILFLTESVSSPAIAQVQTDKTLLAFKEEKISVAVSEFQEEASVSYVLSVPTAKNVKFNSFILHDPVRLVIDIWGPQISRNKVFTFEDHPFLQALRIANDGPKVRLVVDWKEASLPFWETRYENGAVRLLIRHSGIAIPPTPAVILEDETTAEPDAPIALVPPEAAVPATPEAMATEEPAPETQPTVAIETPTPSETPQATEPPQEIVAQATSTPEAPTPTQTPTLTPTQTPTQTATATPTEDLSSAGTITAPGLEAGSSEKAELILAIASPQALTPEPIIPAEPAPQSTQLKIEQPGLLAPMPVTMMPVPGEQPASKRPLILSVRRADGSSEKSKEVSDIVLPGGMPSAEELLKFSVDRVFVPFRSNRRPVEDVTVKNKTDKPLYITAQAQRLLRPGFGDQNLVQTQELLASPKRFQLEPNGTRTVRMVLQKPAADEEQVYRVTFLPQLDSFDKTLLQGEIKGKPANIGVVAGLAITVSSQPADLQPKLEWIPSETGGAILTNTGKVSVVLESGKFCPARGGVCSAVAGKRLYPGNSWKLETQKAGTLEFLQKSGEEFEPLIIKLKGPAR